MNTYYLNGTMRGKRITLKRISFQKAQKCFENNLDVLLTPVKMQPFSDYGLSVWTSRNMWGSRHDFAQEVAGFQIYNCNHETGRYPAFYIPVRYEDRFSGEEVPHDAYGAIETYDYSFMA